MNNSNIDSSAERARQAARDILNFVNCYGFDAKTFAETIAQDHKTLQQSTMRLFIATIREMSKVFPDERNRETVELAKRIVEISNGYCLPFI